MNFFLTMNPREDLYQGSAASPQQKGYGERKMSTKSEELIARNQKRVEEVKRSIAWQFELWTRTIKPDQLEDAIHPCERDRFIPEFCDWLKEQQRLSAEIRASND